MLTLENITGGYNATRDILDGASIRIDKGETVGIIGLNGSGKSTLGKAVMNMLPRRTGRVLLDGADVSSFTTPRLIRAGIGYMMQGAPVFDQLTVAENFRLACGEFPSRGGVTEGRGDLSLPSNRGADKLSGGERHQLALRLAIAKPVKLLILDEPSAGLDPAAATSLYETLETVRTEKGVTILLIEQNVHLANKFCHRIMMMRQGRLENAPQNT